jgi:RsiW-degrading membrane proteinase PrsW (M82 family)
MIFYINLAILCFIPILLYLNTIFKYSYTFSEISFKEKFLFFASGILSVFVICIHFKYFTDYKEPNSFWESFLSVGVKEESLKLFPLLFFVFKNKYNSWKEIVIISMIIASGFAFIENFLYSFLLSENSAVKLAALRSVSSLPAHLVLGSITGTSFYFLKQKRLFWFFAIFFTSALFHNIYNYYVGGFFNAYIATTICLFILGGIFFTYDQKKLD